MRFAQLARQVLRDLTSNTQSSVTFSQYTKEQILTYLKSPQANAKNLRNASIYMFNNSSHYRRLIQYYAYLPSWKYVIAPVKLDGAKINKETVRKNYVKIINTVENMNLRHEMQKAALIALREGVFYGAIWSTNDSFFIQRINPDYCDLTSISDGCYVYAVDMSQIKEEDLKKYPPEFTNMRREYERTGQKYIEVPETISFCLKADETTTYPFPPFASTLISLYDIEDYKGMLKTKAQISNYKALSMKIPLNKDGTPMFSYDIAYQYYQQAASVLPDYVGLIMSPMEIDSWDFEKSGGVDDTDIVSEAEEEFWNSTGTSSLLFGNAKNTSSSALNLSIKADEDVAFALMEQCQRLINRYLKFISGSTKFKLQFLPITRYSEDKVIDYYKTGGTLGIPVKSYYAASIGLTPSDQYNMQILENEVLELHEKLIPLTSSYTQSSDNSPGRPTNESNGDELSEAGEQTLESGQNDNKV